jgi:hypothetical protein
VPLTAARKRRLRSPFLVVLLFRFLSRLARLHHRAADLPGHAATRGVAHDAFTRDPDITVPTRAANVPARFYRRHGRRAARCC